MLRRLATLSACAVVLALLSPSPAHAGSRTLVDGRGDVWALDSPEFGQNTQVPDRQQGDIIRTVFAHHDRKVVVRTTFVQLDRVGQMWVMPIKLRTSTGMVRRISLIAGPDQFTNWWRGSLTRANGAPMECANHRIDYVANVVQVRIPRTCLGDPRWVQGSLATATFTPAALFADNPVHEGPTVRFPGFTTRIFRG